MPPQVRTQDGFVRRRNGFAWRTAGRDRQTSECHRHLIRTVLSARFAYFVCEGGMAPLTRAIGIAIRIVGYCRDDHAVAVNVDIGRSRSAPGEVHYLPPAHFGAKRGEHDLARCGCSRRGRSRRRCRCCRRCRSGRWCRRRRWPTHELPIGEGILLGLAADGHAPIHPRSNVLGGQRRAIVVVARIGRLDARVGLRRQED